MTLFQNRKRALKWLQRYNPRSTRYRRMDSAAIEFALKFHLFDPVSKLFRNQTYLTQQSSLKALDISHGLLTDLSPYFSTRNIITFSERLAKILAYSEPGFWLIRHQDCVLQLTQFVKLAILRCSKPDLAVIVWSFGKFGPQLLSLELEEGEFVRNLLMRILQRLQEPGVKGDLDCVAVNNLLNGLCNLEVPLGWDLRTLILTQLKLHVEFASARELTRLIWSLQKLDVVVDDELLSMICNTAQIKAKASSFSSKEFIYFAWMLSQWKWANPTCQGFADSFLQFLHRKGPDQSIGDVVLGLEAVIKFGVFPDDSSLDLIARRVQDNLTSLSPKIWSSFLKSFAELGIRPVKVLEPMKEIILDQEVNIPMEELCNLFQSMCILNSMEVELLQNWIPELNTKQMELSESQKAILYQVILHLSHFTNSKEQSQTSLDPSFVDSLRQSWKCEERNWNNKLESRIRSLKRKLPSRMKVKTKEAADGDFVFPVLLMEDGTKQVIMFGPNTFRNKEKRLFGSVLWRKRILHNLGWSSIDVDSTSNSELIASFQTR